MKLKKLTIENIASIESAEIDFSAAPLANTSLFLISGDTGSGKTTILDCICLALYNSTPRLKDAKSRPFSVAGQKGNDEITGQDPRNLLRRNTVLGKVQLTFEGNNGVDYKATWLVSRANKKPSGKLQTRIWKLKKNVVPPPPDMTLKEEIEAEIKMAVGMDFEQFCRMSMLAQGDFTKFLKSNVTEKSQILEKITGTGIYTVIGKKIWEINSRKKGELVLLQKELGQYTVLTEEQETEMAGRIAELKEQLVATKDAMKRIDEKLGWLGEDDKIRKEIDKACADNKAYQETAATDVFKKQAELVEKWKATETAQQYLLGLNRSKSSLNNKIEEIEAMAKQCADLMKGANWLADEIARNEKRKQECLHELDAMKSYVPVLEHKQTIEEQLKAKLDAEKSISNFVKELDEKKKQLLDMANDIKSLATNVDEAKAKLAEVQLRLDAKAAEVGKCNKNEVVASIAQLSEKLNVIREAIMAVERYADCDAECKKARAKEEDIANSLKTIETQGVAKKAEVVVMEENCKAQREVCEKTRASIQDWAREARHKLAVGDACPVCGQTVTELRSDESFQSVLEPQEQLLTRMEQELADKNKQLSDIKALYSTTMSQLKSAKTDVDSSAKKLEKAEAAKKQYAEKCGSDDAGKLAEQKQMLEEQQKSQNVLLEQVTKLEAELAAIQKEKDKAQDLLQKAERKLSDTKTKESNRRTEIAGVEKMIAEAQNRSAEAAKNIAATLGDSKWQHDWASEPQSFCTELNEMANRNNSLTDEAQRLGSKLEMASLQSHSVADTLGKIAEAMPQWEAVATHEKQEIKDLQGKCVAFHNDLVSRIAAKRQIEETIADTTKNLHAELAAKGVELAELEQLCKEEKSHIDAIAKAQNEVQEKLKAAAIRIGQLTGDLEQLLQRKPAFAEGENAETLATVKVDTDVKIADLHKEEASLEVQLENNEKLKRDMAGVLKRIEAKTEEVNKWNRFCSLLGDGEGKTLRGVAQSMVLKNLLINANRYLKLLSPRYELCGLRDSLHILVNDRYQLNAVRPSGSLSGGESFIVSLSLALALSSICGNRRAMDVLFIDEGFGTLSDEPQAMVMDMLQSLHVLSGQRVGIISHVDELRERVPVQIKVEPTQDKSASTVSVVTLK